MNEKTDEQWAQQILENPSSKIVDLLKAAAHPARIKMLALLLKGKHSFSQLKSHTSLSKTALANHLTQLIELQLIQRIGRGTYQLTNDGKDLLIAAARTFEASALREEERRLRLHKAYTEGIRERKRMSKKIISKPAEYQVCWLSYTGAMAGSLQALGVDCDVVDVGGRSGYAFLINVSKKDTCPSGPTAFPNETWNELVKATEDLGWTIEQYEDESVGSGETEKLSPEEYARREKLFEKVKLEIDEQNRPVVLWGLAIPEYGIVNGYERNTYLTSTYRRLSNQPEDPIPFFALQAPGCLHALFFREQVKRKQEAINRNTLERAIRFARGNVPTYNQYVAGPAALEAWAAVLETLPSKEQSYHGNSYVGACVWEGRALAAEFIERLAKQCPKRVSKHLITSSKYYHEGKECMKEFMEIFPFSFEGDMPLEKRKKGARILRKVKPLEEAAIENMQKALDSWKTS
jgi:DNA-binding transcriptional ArsR family regulator